MGSKKDNDTNNEEQRLALKRRAMMVLSQNPNSNRKYANINADDFENNLDSEDVSDNENADLVPVVTTLEENEVPDQAGAILRHAREKLGLTQREVATELLCKVSTIYDIEEDRFNQSTAAPFAIKKLRAYAQFVKIDPDTIENIYKQNLNIETQKFEERAKAKHRKNRSHYFFIIAFILIVGSTAFYAMLPDEDEELSGPITQELSLNNKNKDDTIVVEESYPVEITRSNNNVLYDTNIVDVNTQKATEQQLAIKNNLETKTKNNALSTNEDKALVINNKVLVTQDKEKEETVASKEIVKSNSAIKETSVKHIDEEKDQEVSVKLNNNVRDISSQVKLIGREGLASMNSVKITVKGDVAINVTDSRKASLKQGIFKKNDVITITGIPPIVVSTSDTSLIQIHYMGGTIKVPNSKQVKFVLPNK